MLEGNHLLVVPVIGLAKLSSGEYRQASQRWTFSMFDLRSIWKWKNQRPHIHEQILGRGGNPTRLSFVSNSIGIKPQHPPNIGRYWCNLQSDVLQCLEGNGPHPRPFGNFKYHTGRFFWRKSQGTKGNQVLYYTRNNSTTGHNNGRISCARQLLYL